MRSIVSSHRAKAVFLRRRLFPSSLRYCVGTVSCSITLATERLTAVSLASLHELMSLTCAEYGAAEFFLQQSRLARALQKSLFGRAWPFAEVFELGSAGVSAHDPQLLGYLSEARLVLEGQHSPYLSTATDNKGITSKDWLKDSLDCWPVKVRDAMKSITRI